MSDKDNAITLKELTYRAIAIRKLQQASGTCALKSRVSLLQSADPAEVF